MSSVCVINFDKVLFNTNIIGMDGLTPIFANELYDGVKVLLQKLKKNGQRLVVISNRQDGSLLADECYQVLKSNGIVDLLDLLVIGHSNRAEMLNSLVKALELPEDTVLYIFDFDQRNVEESPTRKYREINIRTGLTDSDIYEFMGILL